MKLYLAKTLIFVAILMLPATIAHAQGGGYQFTPIATPGLACSPDAIALPVLNNVGMVAFFDNCSRILRGNGETPIRLFDLYVPGCSGASSWCFVGFGSPSLSISDDSVVTTLLTRFDNTTHKFFDSIVALDGTPPRFILDGETASAQFNSPVVANNGPTAVRVASDAIRSGILSVNGGVITSVAASGMQTPVGELSGVGTATINSFNRVAFTGFINGRTELFAAENGEIRHISSADTSTYLSMNESGNVAFTGGGSLNVGDESSVRRIATEYAADPTSPFTHLGQSSLNGDGDIAFVGDLTSGGRGIFTGVDPVKDKVVAVGDVLPGGFDVVLLDMTAEGLNDLGQIAFIVQGSAGRAVFRADPPGSTSLNPVLPTNPTPPWRLPAVVNPGRANRMWFFDPPVATGYSYTAGPGVANFRSVLIPAALPAGDNQFEVVFGPYTLTLNAGIPFAFTEYLVDGVRSFEITGIDPVENLNPNDALAFVTGVTFMGASNGEIVMTPIDDGPTRYEFSGFLPPIHEMPLMNQVRAGRAIPTKFSLNGYQGLDIFATNSPRSIQIGCEGSDQVGIVEATATAGNSSLSYDPARDEYSYVWKTDKSWSSTCRALILEFRDGSRHDAHFSFSE